MFSAIIFLIIAIICFCLSRWIHNYDLITSIGFLRMSKLTIVVSLIFVILNFAS